MKLSLLGYGIGVHRPSMIVWRGHKVPFILQLWLYYPTGSRCWKTLIGPNFMDWAKQR